MQVNTQSAFRSLSDPTRRSIIKLLEEDSRSISDVVEHFDISRNAIVKHLRVLEESAVVRTHYVGRERVNVLVPGALKPAYDWLTPYETLWDQKLDALQRAVEETYRG